MLDTRIFIIKSLEGGNEMMVEKQDDVSKKVLNMLPLGFKLGVDTVV